MLYGQNIFSRLIADQEKATVTKIAIPNQCIVEIDSTVAKEQASKLTTVNNKRDIIE